MRQRPPHIVVTTPESLYVLLGSESGRRMLATTRTVIVDEIHALASNKRGSHLALSLARLDALVERPLTDRPVRDAEADRRGGALPGRRRHSCRRAVPRRELHPLGGQRSGAAASVGGSCPCAIVDTGHVRPRDLALEVPASPLEAVMSNEVWLQVYARLADLIAEHRTTLVFVNTRRMAERVTRHLSELLGIEHVMAHHGSMAKDAAPVGGTASQARRAEGAGRDGVARARHRHRRRRPRLPARIAALDRGVPAARGSREPHGARRAEGAAFPAVARRARRMHGAARCRRPRRARPADDSGQAARRARAADRRRSRGARMARARTLRSAHARVLRTPDLPTTNISTSCARLPTASRRGRDIAARMCTAMPSTACCARGAARA